MTACASAPGKLMLAGEYAVLEGAWALVAAVDRRAFACWARADNGSQSSGRNSAESGSLPPEALLTRSLAERLVGTVPHSLSLDVSALRSNDRKLGLGSSAAGAAAVAGAVFAHAGRDITRADVRREILDVALEGHRTVAPQGSGADVAASVLGGFVRFRSQERAPVSAEPVAWPRGLEARVVWTGKQARTSALVARVRELDRSDRATFRSRMDALRNAAEAFVTAFVRDDAQGTIEASRVHHRAMRELGQAAGAPIVEERLARVAELARQAGGAAKPSGAGGGDVAVALFARESAAEAFEARCGGEGMEVLSLGLGAEGVVPLEAPCA